MVFDVNETLLDLEMMQPIFESICGESAHVLGKVSLKIEAARKTPYRAGCAQSSGWWKSE
jgi:hypothetical protein